MRSLVALLSLIVVGSFWPRFVQAQDWPFNSVSASSSVWAASNLADGSTSTQWSSSGHTGPNNTEWIAASFAGPQQLNYVKLYPRVVGTTVYAFPEHFTVFYSNGSSWVPIDVLTYAQSNPFPSPSRNEYITLVLPNTVTAYGIHIVATKLRPDSNGNYFFQLGEIKAGHHVAFTKLRYRGNSGDAGYVHVTGVGAGPYQTGKEKVWNYDVRNPILTADSINNNCPTTPYHGSMTQDANGIVSNGALRNIYAPSVLKEGTTWKIFYGGYDDICASTEADRIYSVTATGDFMPTSPGGSWLSNRQLVFEGAAGSGGFQALNNASVVATNGGTQLTMIATGCAVGVDCTYFNKPTVAYSSSSGASGSWAASVGATAANATTSANAITMAGYLDGTTDVWGGYTSGENINGSHALLFEGGTYYLYFKGKWQYNYFATSSDGKSYTLQTPTANASGGYQGKALSAAVTGEPWGFRTCFNHSPNDVKKINGVYFWLFYYQCANVHYTTSTSKTQWPAAGPQVLFNAETLHPALGIDKAVVTPTLVTDGIRLYGVLYAGNAGNVNTAPGNGVPWADNWRNRIFARWLQRKVALASSALPGGGQTDTLAKGTETTLLSVPASLLAEGSLTLKDADNSTVLLTTPAFTLRSGDVWEYVH